MSLKRESASRVGGITELTRADLYTTYNRQSQLSRCLILFVASRFNKAPNPHVYSSPAQNRRPRTWLIIKMGKELEQPVSFVDSAFFSRYLGVTPPISVLESSPREKEVTVTLMEELRRQNTFESEQEAK